METLAPEGQDPACLLPPQYLKQFAPQIVCWMNERTNQCTNEGINAMSQNYGEDNWAVPPDAVSLAVGGGGIASLVRQEM